jgi:putative ABC transport system permease protein
VRHALGASRRRLARQFITESLLLGLVGGGLGMLVAVWAVDGVTALIPRSAPRASEITLDGAAVAFAVACSILAALMFGLAPIVHARRTDLYGALKDGSPKLTGSKARLRARRALVISEIALATVLVIGCTVMVRSFVRLQRTDVGFNPDRLLTFELSLPAKAYTTPGIDAFWHRLEDRMRALPGVKSATLIDGLPPDRPINANDMAFPGRAHVPNERPWNVDYWQVISDDAIETMGAHIVRGRNLARTDSVDAPLVALVNETFANTWWPGEDPIGKKINLTPWGKNEDDHVFETVVGVIGDIKQGGIDKPVGTEAWVPMYQFVKMFDPPEMNNGMNVLLRTEGDPKELIPAVTRIVADMDPTLPLYRVRTMDDVMWEAVARPRFLTFLLTCFAGIALLLAAVGIYGVMAHTVAQRTHEIGLRVALGAQPAQVRKMVLRQAGVLVAGGVAVGLAAAVALQWLLDSSLRGLFYGAELSQPVMLGGVAIVVTVAALLATWVPVRRATNVQPTVALRNE